MLKNYYFPCKCSACFFNLFSHWIGENESLLGENKYFFYAGKFMIYMQALRFITDHINDDIYYGAKYEGQNLVRASNQMVLLQRYLEKENDLGT